MDKGLFATFHWPRKATVHASSAHPVTFGNSFAWNRNGPV